VIFSTWARDLRFWLSCLDSGEWVHSRIYFIVFRIFVRLYKFSVCKLFISPPCVKKKIKLLQFCMQVYLFHPYMWKFNCFIFCVHLIIIFSVSPYFVLILKIVKRKMRLMLIWLREQSRYKSFVIFRGDSSLSGSPGESPKLDHCGDFLRWLWQG
jgi:hypothetical protein